MATPPWVLAAFWIPLAICVVVACSPESSVPGPQIGGTLAHIVAFTYLAWALFPAHFPARPTRPVRPAAPPAPNDAGSGEAPPAGPEDAGWSEARRFLAVALWMLAFGVAIEVLQVFVAGRHGTVMDLLPDGAGIALGCVAHRAWRGKLQPRRTARATKPPAGADPAARGAAAS